jgi:hypothetical protein
MKLYFFMHSYLTPIRLGIQSGHAAVELMLKYKNQKTPQARLVNKWAKLYKTFILLDGGVTGDLNKARKLIKKSDLSWAEFREPDCGNMVTVIAVVVPDDFLDSISEKKIQRPLWKLFTESRLAK